MAGIIGATEILCWPKQASSEGNANYVYLLYTKYLLFAKNRVEMGEEVEVPSFDVGKIDFGASLLRKEPGEERGTGSTETIAIDPDQAHQEVGEAKEIVLESGKKIVLKRKLRTKANPLDIAKQVASEKENYGTNINELYAKLERQRLEDQNQSQQQESYLKNISSDSKSILWAEKYRPKSFFDLVGNDFTNRKILKWFKLWSRTVFNSNFNPITLEEMNELKTSDLFGRPDRKILLIHGPPGLGKTTVAHVIANQVGYEVLEINASDERSGQRVREKINNSITSLSFSGKPVCLIADEIDGGAESGFIKVLLDIINEDTKAVYEFKTNSSGNKKKKQKHKFLLRPIIAICNDLYAPALEKLRIHTELVGFNQASQHLLSSRLKNICKLENISISNQDLQQIIQLTNHDIRSCLNILQFGGGINNESRKKDTQISWFLIVNEIFKRNLKLDKSAEFKEISQSLSNVGNIDKVINGCFQSLHDIKYQDTNFEKLENISNWLFFNDLISKTVFENNGDLSYYSTQVALQFRNLFNDSFNNSQMLKVKSDYEYFEKQKLNRNLMSSIYNHINSNLKSQIKLNQLPVEVLPFLDFIITPNLKNFKKFENFDLVKVNDVIDSLQGFGLEISKGKDDGYNEIYNTYPDFSSLTKFNENSVKKDLLTRSSMYPFIQKEIELNLLKKRAFSQINNGGDESSSGNQNLNNFNNLKNQYETIAANEEKNKKQKVSDKIWVKYHEGFSNAVRKNVKWKNLWEF